MTGMERLLSYYNSASPESMQAAIVRGILKNIRRVGDLTIYDLAEICYTSPASLSRLVRKLGYKNYAYFQKDLSDAVEKYDRHNRLVSPEQKPEDESMPAYFFRTLEGLYESFKGSLDMEKVDQLVEMMHRANKVAIYSQSIYMIEFFIQSDMFMDGKICDLHQQEKDIYEHVKVLTDKDLVILVAPGAPEGFPAEKLVRLCHDSKAKVCLITESKKSAKMSSAELSIVLPGVHMAADMFVMQLCLSVVDMTYRERYLE